MTVKLKNGKKIKGYVSDVKPDSFVVSDKNGTQTEVSYSDVREAKGENRSTGAAIVGTIGVVLLLGLIFQQLDKR